MEQNLVNVNIDGPTQQTALTQRGPVPVQYQQQQPQQVIQKQKSMEGELPMPSAPRGLMFPRAPPSAIEKAEVAADSFLKFCAPVIRPLARLFLLCTFVEDAERMIFQWDIQANHVSKEWQADPSVGHAFVAFNLAAQAIPCAILLLGFPFSSMKPLIQACLGLLVIVVCAQSVAYHVLWNLEFFLRNLAVIGALCLVGAEALEPEPTKGGILDTGRLTEEDEDDDVSDILRLSGRVLLSLMFLTLVKFDNVQRIILECIAAVLLALVVIGFKTKLSAVTLFIFLFVENLYLNDFFMHSSDENIHDFKKFNFFQALTVIGGLMMLVALGPGGVSFDGEEKKYR
eukprot:m.84356 g.84356  ORF g.84356 m.84356 type:complete len:343 (+) comp12961_c0_seq3:105-1133(+)